MLYTFTCSGFLSGNSTIIVKSPTSVPATALTAKSETTASADTGDQVTEGTKIEEAEGEKDLGVLVTTTLKPSRSAQQQLKTQILHWGKCKGHSTSERRAM